MRSEPAVSAVICFLDAERFLREAIHSVWAQTFTDWELLLVDDGSRDGGRAIALEMLAQCPDRMRLLEHPGRDNRGISASRNLALRAARGRYVAFLDADDVWLPEKLERQVALCDKPGHLRRCTDLVLMGRHACARDEFECPGR